MTTSSCRRHRRASVETQRGYAGFYDLRGEVVIAKPFTFDPHAVLEHELIHVNLVNCSTIGRLEHLAFFVWEYCGASEGSFIDHEILEPIRTLTEEVHEGVAWGALCTWDGRLDIDSVPSVYQRLAQSVGVRLIDQTAIVSRPTALGQMEDLAIAALSPSVIPAVWEDGYALQSGGLDRLLRKPDHSPLSRLHLLLDGVAPQMVDTSRIRDLSLAGTYRLASWMARMEGQTLTGDEFAPRWAMARKLDTFRPDVEKYCQVSILGVGAVARQIRELTLADAELDPRVTGLMVSGPKGSFDDEVQVFRRDPTMDLRLVVALNDSWMGTTFPAANLSAMCLAWNDLRVPVAVDASSFWAHYVSWRSLRIPCAIMSRGSVRHVCLMLAVQLHDGGSSAFEFSVLFQRDCSSKESFLLLRPVDPRAAFVIVVPILTEHAGAVVAYLESGVRVDSGISLLSAFGSGVQYKSKPGTFEVDYDDPWLGEYAPSVRWLLSLQD